ncbi:MAG: 2-amino-4-hydroxy-6-hydroxymethyldihydropteridine diphosphokinase [Bacteroidetes bacterium]|nr:2-amino-4-hydroxy-6-hydroxymethyldihydropteridine diphosphokinase [Bacteroidota bacterium]MBS1629830.1 2-amino-4-hydroxy-6-hydroxymethyldihydropteridine diphosphokinase [Bacteroidota bacterium]
MNEAVFLLLGSNLGQREALLTEAIRSLSHFSTSPLRCSSLYETAAWGIEDQASFLNIAIGMRCGLQPEVLLQEMSQIEERLGRQRSLVWGPRTLDIDMLLWGQRIIHSEALQVPHPRLPERRFALAPLAEIAAAHIHPEAGCSIAELLAACSDPLPVMRLGMLPGLPGTEPQNLVS